LASCPKVFFAHPPGKILHNLKLRVLMMIKNDDLPNMANTTAEGLK